MNDFQQPKPDDLDVSPDMGTRSARPRRLPSSMSTLGLVTAVVAALVAGPAVASRLGSIGTDPAGSYTNLGQVTQEAPLPKPTTTPENANQREGRTADPSPAPTGQNANQREGRTVEPDCP